MRPFHSARTLVQRIHLTTLQFTFYYLHFPYREKEGEMPCMGFPFGKTGLTYVFTKKKKKTYVYNYIYHVYRNRYRIPDA